MVFTFSSLYVNFSVTTKVLQEKKKSEGKSEGKEKEG